MKLDIPTLSLITAVAQLVFALSCLLLARLIRDVDYIRAWSWGSGLIAFQAVLVALRGTIPDFISIVLANPSSLLGISCIYIGTRGLLLREPPGPWIWLPAMLSLPVFAWFTLVQPNVAARIATYSFVAAPLLGACAWEFWRRDRADGPTPLRLANLFTVFIFAIGTLLFLARAGIALNLPADTSYFQSQNPLVVAPYLYAILFSIWLAIMVTLTVSARLQNELMVARDRAEAASRAKGQFLANMSHEVRTPMNGVVGMAQLLQWTPLNDEQQEYVTGIRSSAESLLTVINDILDFSKAEAGRIELERITFCPRDVMRKLDLQYAPMAKEKQLALDVATDTDVPDTIVGDPARLAQILTNLLGNAIKFTAQGRIDLRLSCIEHGTRLRFEIRDTGIGMGPETLEGLFAPFFQADASTTRRFGGTGLGLSIAHHLVELMDGRISVTSEIGQGTCFTIEMPIRPDA